MNKQRAAVCVLASEEEGISPKLHWTWTLIRKRVLLGRADKVIG